MKRLGSVFLLATIVVGFSMPLGADPPEHRKLSAVPFTQVKVHDAFWAPRLKTNREVSLPHNFKWCEETGRFRNFAKAAGLVEGEFEGIYFNDSDVYK
ncbi:MAG: glycoside hydrolase family 127 protein, partial [Planctomycetota bacterium]